MILLMAEGESNRSIGATVDLHYNQVGIWRTAMKGSSDWLDSDEDRPGRPAIYDHDDVLLLVKLVTGPPAGSVGPWAALAGAMAEHGVAISPAFPGLADLQGSRSQALAGRVVDDELDPDFGAERPAGAAST